MEPARPLPHRMQWVQARSLKDAPRGAPRRAQSQTHVPHWRPSVDCRHHWCARGRHGSRGPEQRRHGRVVLVCELAPKSPSTSKNAPGFWPRHKVQHGITSYFGSVAGRHLGPWPAAGRGATFRTMISFEIESRAWVRGPRGFVQYTRKQLSRPVFRRRCHHFRRTHCHARRRGRQVVQPRPL